MKLDLPATINLLGETLGEVLREQESLALFQTEEEIRALAKGRRGGEAVAAPQLSRQANVFAIISQGQNPGAERCSTIVSIGLIPWLKPLVITHILQPIILDDLEC